MTAAIARVCRGVVGGGEACARAGAASTCTAAHAGPCRLPQLELRGFAVEPAVHVLDLAMGGLQARVDDSGVNGHTVARAIARAR